VRRNAALAAAALAGVALGALVGRKRRTLGRRPEPGDPRAHELRRKLAEARQTPPDEDDFEVAGMGAETLVEDVPRVPPPPAPRPAPPASDEPPPADEFEAMRRRIHEEARAAAEEMRRAGEPREH
jgi:hypothetical protein